MSGGDRQHLLGFPHVEKGLGPSPFALSRFLEREGRVNAVREIRPQAQPSCPGGMGQSSVLRSVALMGTAAAAASLWRSFVAPLPIEWLGFSVAIVAGVSLLDSA